MKVYLVTLVFEWRPKSLCTLYKNMPLRNLWNKKRPQSEPLVLRALKIEVPQRELFKNTVKTSRLDSEVWNLHFVAPGHVSKSSSVVSLLRYTFSGLQSHDIMAERRMRNSREDPQAVLLESLVSLSGTCSSWRSPCKHNSVHPTRLVSPQSVCYWFVLILTPKTMPWKCVLFELHRNQVELEFNLTDVSQLTNWCEQDICFMILMWRMSTHSFISVSSTSQELWLLQWLRCRHPCLTVHLLRHHFHWFPQRLFLLEVLLSPKHIYFRPQMM